MQPVTLTYATSDTDPIRRLMDTLDTINRRMGHGTLFYAGSGIKREWKAFATMKTQHFTRDWRQMMEVSVE